MNWWLEVRFYNVRAFDLVKSGQSKELWCYYVSKTSYRKENIAAWKSKSIDITVFLDWQTIDGGKFWSLMFVSKCYCQLMWSVPDICIDRPAGLKLFLDGSKE